MKTGDIVIIDFPFSNLSQTKIRPAVIVTTTSDMYKDVVACIISSVVPGKLNKKEILLKPNAVNNLRATSIIKTYRIATIQQAKIVSHIGKLSASELKLFIATFQSLVQ